MGMSLFGIPVEVGLDAPEDKIIISPQVAALIQERAMAVAPTLYEKAKEALDG